MKREKFSSRSGFTLIELLVVIGIIVVLAAMIVPKISGAKGKALQVSCSTNMKNIVKAMQLYVQDYPSSTCPGDSVTDPTMKEVAGCLYYRYGDKSGGLTTTDIFVCPALKSDSHQGPEIGARYGAAFTADGTDTFIDYALIRNAGALPDFQNDPDDNAVLIENGNYHGSSTNGARNVAFIGGNVQFMLDADIITYKNINSGSGGQFAATITEGTADFLTRDSTGKAWNLDLDPATAP